MIEKIQQNTNPVSELTQLAEQGKWEEIDSILPSRSNNQEVFSWAKENLFHENSEMRDLAASVLESSAVELTDDDIHTLVTLMRTVDEKNPYPTFRAACALSKRLNHEAIDDSLQREIKNTIGLYLDDADVSEIAQKYLNDYFSVIT
jgi:hypothetical protein